MKESRGILTRRNVRIALRREAMLLPSVFILLLNILTGSLSYSHYGAAAALPLNGGKMAICSSKQRVFAGNGGNTIPSDRQQQQHECACCLPALASAVMPPPPPAPDPLQLAVIQVLRPSDTGHLDAPAVPTRRNRGPPFQA
jgi:hypothetical protein